MCSGVRRQCLIKAAPLGGFQGEDGSQSSPHPLPTRTSARLQVFGCPLESGLVFRCRRMQARVTSSTEAAAATGKVRTLLQFLATAVRIFLLVAHLFCDLRPIPFYYC